MPVVAWSCLTSATSVSSAGLTSALALDERNRKIAVCVPLSTTNSRGCPSAYALVALPIFAAAFAVVMRAGDVRGEDHELVGPRERRPARCGSPALSIFVLPLPMRMPAC